MQYADSTQSEQLQNFFRPGDSSLTYSLTHQFLLPESIKTAAESLLTTHSHQPEIQDLLRQLSAIFATVEQLRKLDNYNDPKILQQILILPKIIDALTKELAKQKTALKGFNGSALPQLITTIEAEAGKVYKQLAQDLSEKDSSSDQPEEVQAYITSHGTQEVKESYFKKASKDIFNEPTFTVEEALSKITKLSEVLKLSLSDESKQWLVTKSWMLMHRNGEPFTTKFYDLLKDLPDEKNVYIGRLNALIIEERARQFNERKNDSADHKFNWMINFSKQVRAAEKALGNIFRGC